MEASHCFVPTFQQGGGPGFEHLGGAHGEAVAAPRQHRFSPYVDNGGTTVAVAGEDFCVVAGDTRMSQGFSILTRDKGKCVQLTDKCVVASAGQQAERATLHKVLKEKVRMYTQKYNKVLSTPSIAQMLSNTLYSKRFFPYYTFNIVAGLDEEGVGCVYGYDAVGSFERSKYMTEGSGVSLIQPLLDNQVKFNNQPDEAFVKYTAEETVDLIKDAFTSAGERDIFTGDAVDIYVITASGVEQQSFALKKD
jgi:20S proteasome subunit beta 6